MKEFVRVVINRRGLTAIGRLEAAVWEDLIDRGSGNLSPIEKGGPRRGPPLTHPVAKGGADRAMLNTHFGI